MKFSVRILLILALKIACMATSLFAIVIDNVLVVNTNCPANGNGTITVIVTGGINPIKYELERPDGSKTPTQTANLFDNLASGIYKVNVYDGASGAAIAASTTVEVKSNDTECGFKANDDRVVLFACNNTQVNVTLNDVIVPSTVVSIVNQGNKGIANIISNQIVYNHLGDDCRRKTGLDTVDYDICYSGICDTASVFVNVLKNPQIVLIDSCGYKPKMAMDIQYDASHQWQYCITNSNNNNDWENIDCTTIECGEVKEGWYRVLLNFKGTKTTTNASWLKSQKTQLAGGVFWYEMSLQ